MLIFSSIYENAKQHKTKTCMVFNNDSITYEELIKYIDKKSSFLKEKFKRGEKVIIKDLHPINTIINLLSCANTGLISIPVDNKILHESRNNIRKYTNSSIMMEDNFIYHLKENKEIFNENITEWNLYCKDQKERNICHKNNIKNNNLYYDYKEDCDLYCKDDKDSKLNDNEQEEKTLGYKHKEDYNDIFLGALSSGTTGKRKVVYRDHISWTSAFKYQSEIFNIDSHDTLFLVGSLSYTANLNSAIHMLNEGGTIVFSKSIYPKTWIRQIEQDNITSIFMVPAHYRLLLKELKNNINNIKSLVSAGAKIDVDTVKKLKHRFPKAGICEYYGASELGHITYINFRENFNDNSVGKPFPGVKIWIENIEIPIKKVENNKNTILNEDLNNEFKLTLKKGRVWVESSYIAPAFRPKATVGDIGKIDKQGNLYILGRENGIINKGGVKILPYEVEKILNKHPKIVQSVVFPIADNMKGQEVAAVILTKDRALTRKEIMDYCREHLDSHKRPKKLNIVSNIKLNSNGKIDISELGRV
ncbi:AMP-binding protein [Clostridium sp. Marseille-Q2269]|uniref:AMP-binding protein n=1 Tax=Clostridium sp. Marseille-Q2269 TaxID=2942205 RepID=UPI002072C9A9|nr:AMP-binding protein [Clostridium sp. Marseille-Q2269]